MVAYRNPEVFASSPEPVDIDSGPLGRDQQHAVDGRGPAQALPRSGATVVPAGEWQVVDRQLDHRDRGRARSTGSSTTAAPNSTSTSARPSRCSPSPAASACPIEQALEIRAALGHDPQKVVDMLRPDRRGPPRRAAGRSDQRAGAGRAHRRRRRHHPAHRSRDRLLRAAAARRRLGHHLEADGHHADRAAAASRAAGGGARGSAAAAPGHRGVGAVDADRSDVLPLGDRPTPNWAASRCPPGPSCTSRSAPPTATRPAGTAPTSSTSPES